MGTITLFVQRSLVIIAFNFLSASQKLLDGENVCFGNNPITNRDPYPPLCPFLHARKSWGLNDLSFHFQFIVDIKMVRVYKLHINHIGSTWG